MNTYDSLAQQSGRKRKLSTGTILLSLLGVITSKKGRCGLLEEKRESRVSQVPIFLLLLLLFLCAIDKTGNDLNDHVTIDTRAAWYVFTDRSMTCWS